MAAKTVATTTFYDDITGEEGADTYVLGYRNADGNASWFEIDLTERNADKHITKLVELLNNKGRALRPEDAPVAKSPKRKYSRKADATTSTAKGDTDKVRAWAQENGLEVSDRGRISKAVHEQYNAAHAPAGAVA